MNHHNRRQSRTGFTLVEVLATILLIAIVLPVANKALINAAQLGDQARHRTEAANLARSKLSELIAGDEWDGNGPTSGNFGNDYPGYSWSFTVQAWPNDTQEVGLEELDLTITWQSNGRQDSLTTSSLVYTRPQPTS